METDLFVILHEDVWTLQEDAGGRGEVKEISMSSQVIIFLDDAYEALAMY